MFYPKPLSTSEVTMNSKITAEPADPEESAEAESSEVAPDPVAEALMRVAQPATSVAQLKAADSLIKEEIESNTLTLPPTIEYIENVPDTFNGTAFEVRLYGEGCTECGHLVPSYEEKQTECHFSAGNQFCPAAFTRIVFVGHRQRLVARLQKAQKSGDSNRLIKHLSALESETLEIKQYVLREVGLLPAEVG